MKHQEGVHASLRLKGSNEYITEYPTPSASKHFRDACGRFISTPPGHAFEVGIKFPKELFKNQNIMVIINCGPSAGPVEQRQNYQAWYIPSGSADSGCEFLSFITWEDDLSAPQEIAMVVPDPANYDKLRATATDDSWVDENTASPGCVTVLVLRAAEQLQEFQGKQMATVVGRRNFLASTEASPQGITHSTKTERQARKRRVSESEDSEENEAGEESEESDVEEEDEEDEEEGEEQNSPTRRMSRRRKRSIDYFFAESPDSVWLRPDGEWVPSEDEDDEEVLPQEVKEEGRANPWNQEAILAHASDSPAPEQAQLNLPANASNAVDLTGEQHPQDPSSVPGGRKILRSGRGNRKRRVTIIQSDTDDEEDIEDEMRHIELRRKLRAMRKWKAKAVKKEA
ncbi:hypothetical protein M409DRAFT_28702 [Zasmidium cellare ATCC 36951]|uniref:Uncharacterized protein n=1 Tax=Zasmidium cellare ATCC 36951 TaxID=1080233 RepID=A0A6A6C1T0_ZASCE|nr:uncharacterized protein M409DRAFT_28702 [Zasmidium cellare ATCC 36951]KAF2160823.1 hypothetical protein M409DRAFT_28702 [Zasmidium cellare ATCC 36951]